MIRPINVRCFRRRCQLPVRVVSAHIHNGLVFCSEECFKAWQSECEIAVEVKRARLFPLPIVFQRPVFCHSDWREVIWLSRTVRRYGSKAYRRLLIRRGESRHHRHPRSLGGGNEPSNISVVKQADHNAWHTLFSNYSPETIARIINEKWIPRNYHFICVKDA